MILRRAGLKPLCRQCGHAFDEPAARCPACGMRSGFAEPLRRPLRESIVEPSLDSDVVSSDEMESIDGDDVVLGPEVERLPAEPFSAETPVDHYDPLASNDEPIPVARNVSVGSMMLGTLLIAACLGLGRFSTFAGVTAFLVLVPAYIRTLSAIWYYRKQDQQLSRRQLADIYSVSFVLSLMALAAGGLVFAVSAFVCGLIVPSLGIEQPVVATTIAGTTAAFFTIVVLVHKVWPVNQD